MVDLRKETNPDILRQAALLLDKENQRLHERLKTLAEEIDRLRGNNGSVSQLELELKHLQERLGARERMIFGRSSEKRPVHGDTPSEKKERPGHGPRPQKELPVQEVLHELPEEGRACDVCGGRLDEMPGQFEESEELTVVRRLYVMRLHKRQKYRCSCMEKIVTAPGPLKLIPGGRYSIDFAAQIAVDKYLDHMPLERQVRAMRREGLEIDSQTLWDQIQALSRHLRPTYEAIGRKILSEPVIFADETRWPLLKKGGSGRGWVWSVSCATGSYYKILESRSADAAREVLGGYVGTVMADGYGAYESLSRGSPSFRLAHCWAHVRRKFREAEPHYPEECGEILDMIGELYAVEGEVPKPSPGVPGEEVRTALDLRRRLRGERSREIVARIREWTYETKPAALPQSALGKALAYMMGMWAGLTVFLDDPLVPLDNNAAERSLRGVVVGRKNHYGSRSKRGSEVAALFYTLLESAKLCGRDPRAYLQNAARRAIETPGAVTPPDSPD